MAEMIELCKNRKEVFMLLQGNGRLDYNYTTPRGMVTIIIMFIKLRLEHIVAIRNIPRCSIFNPAERAMSTLDFGL